MSLLREKNKAPACSCGHPTSESEKTIADCCAKKSTEITCIKVLGAGCKSCHKQYENVKEAVKSMRLSVEVEYITDMKKVMDYAVMSVPAIVVNKKVVSIGKVLKVEDVKKILDKTIN